MKRVISAGMVVLYLFSFGGAASASDIDELKSEIKRLREDYESKIGELQAKVEALEEGRKEDLAKVEEKVEKKFLDVEYVGRYKGPFKKGGLLVKNPFGFGNVSVGGYMDHEFEAFENGKSTFDQHRWIINVGAELMNRLRFYSEYEIEHGGTDASGGGEAKVEQAWLDYLVTDWFNLRAGALLVPFGRYNLYHDSDLQDLTDRPIVARRIIPTTWTEAGAGIYGEYNPKIGNYEDLTLGYEAYVINGLNSGFSDTGLRGAVGSLESDNNSAKSLVGRVVASPFIGHEIALSGYWGKYNTLDDHITGVAADWLSTWGPLEFVGEYAYFNIDEPAGTNLAEYLTGYYLQANYHFWPKFLNNTFLGKYFDNPKFTLVGRYDWSKIDDDSDSGAGSNEESRITFGLNYRPVESWVLKFEYQINDTKNESLERGDNNGFIASAAMGF